jgi:PIN domain nuclease of toxin-antitoxin system
MKLLIDTQAILWFQGSDNKLTSRARDLMSDENNVCFVSIASLWEIAIKVNLNKLTIGMPFKDFCSYLTSANFEILNLKFTHLNKLSELDMHHKDPFDRMIISQAMEESLFLISADDLFQSYPVNVIW